MPDPAHVTRLDEFATDVARYLTAAWREDVRLVVCVDEGRPQAIETIADLEKVHDALSGYPLGPLPASGEDS